MSSKLYCVLIGIGVFVLLVFLLILGLRFRYGYIRNREVRVAQNDIVYEQLNHACTSFTLEELRNSHFDDICAELEEKVHHNVEEEALEFTFKEWIPSSHWVILSVALSILIITLSLCIICFCLMPRWNHNAKQHMPQYMSPPPPVHNPKTDKKTK